MCQLFTILLETSRRDAYLYRRVAAEEQDAIAADMLCYPEIFLALAKVVQTEAELLPREVQQIAGGL